MWRSYVGTQSFQKKHFCNTMSWSKAKQKSMSWFFAPFRQFLSFVFPFLATKPGQKLQKNSPGDLSVWKNLPGQISTTKILGPKLVKTASSVRKLQRWRSPGDSWKGGVAAILNSLKKTATNIATWSHEWINYIVLTVGVYIECILIFYDIFLIMRSIGR